MSEGYVYILRNEAMKGLVKIGRTTRTIPARLNELQTTGVPFPFEVVTSVLSPDCAELEARVHRMLATCRVNNQREFFLCEEKIAATTLEDEHREMVEEWRLRYMGDDFDDESDLRTDPSLAYIWAHKLGVSPYDVIFAFDMIEEADMRAAVNRFRLRKGEPLI
jgi:hypothetical protein